MNRTLPLEAKCSGRSFCKGLNNFLTKLGQNSNFFLELLSGLGSFYFLCGLYLPLLG